VVNLKKNGVLTVGYKTIILEKNGVIGKLTFNRPEVLNAYNRIVSDELIDGVQALAKDDSIRVIVITGAGKAFMAGADINMVNEWAELADTVKIRQTLEKMFNPNMLEDCPKPTIAAVNGIAFGMGCEVALGCDFRIASEKAKFALPEVKLGVVPGAGGSQRAFHLIGGTRAIEMITTGDPIDAAEAYRIGLINQVVPHDQLWDAVDAFIGRLTSKSKEAIRTCKNLIYRGGDLPLRQGIEYERDQFCEVLLTEGAKEGTLAFLEKRKPIFN
jgi:enoyl-CoA hydratase